MKTFKLCSLSLLLSLAGLVYAAGTQSASRTNGAANPSCCAASAACCAGGAACCKSDKADNDGPAGCCAGGVCKMHADGAAPHAQGHEPAATHAAHDRARHAALQTAHAQNGAADACPSDGCCTGHKAEGQHAAAHGDCCKMHGDKAHAVHAQRQGVTTGGESARASCCVMDGPGAKAAQAGDAKSCCAPGAACCATVNAACCAADKAPKP